MSDWSPATVPRPWLVALGLLYVLLLGYAVLVAQVLLGGLLAGALGLVLYLAWRFVVAVEGIADAQQRIADRRERG